MLISPYDMAWQGGNLSAYVRTRGGLPEPEARCFFQQLVNGVEICHKMKVANRDIKLQNTLLTSGLLKICDFGFSKSSNNSRAMTRLGTPEYAGVP